MKTEISLAQIEVLFDEYNEECFGGILPKPSFGLMKSFKNFGMFSCHFDGDEIISPLIEMSKNYIYDEVQIRDILLHEMIHYYLAYMGIDMKLSHGKHFKKMANDFNKNFGTNIHKKVDEDEFELSENASKIGYFFSKLF